MRAGEYYRRAASARIGSEALWTAGAPHWVQTQALSIDGVSGEKLNAYPWMHARRTADVELGSSNPLDVAWAYASLVEIYLLRAFVPDKEHLDGMTWDTARTRALESAGTVADAAQLNAFIVESTRRQINRYVNWWFPGRNSIVRARSLSLWERAPRSGG